MTDFEEDERCRESFGDNPQEWPYYGMRQMFRHARGNHSLCIPENCELRKAEAEADARRTTMKAHANPSYRTPAVFDDWTISGTHTGFPWARIRWFLAVSVLLGLIFGGAIHAKRTAPVVGRVTATNCALPHRSVAFETTRGVAAVYEPRTIRECENYKPGAEWMIHVNRDGSARPDYPR